MGYIAAIIIGITLGVFGGGGSILTVPVLVYIFKILPIHATAYSLFIIGITSLINSITNIKSGLINYKIAFLFSIPGLSAVYIARKYLIPAIPEHIINFSNFVIDKNDAILIFFSFIMLLASISMIKGSPTNNKVKKDINVFQVIIQSFIIGLITGTVGAGGGFLIVPALIFLTDLEIKNAISTSLLIISINSIFGFLGNLSSDSSFDWLFIYQFIFFTVFGSFIGTYISKKISSQKLKPVFGYFILVMAVFITLKETILR